MTLNGINKNNPYQYMPPAQMKAMFGTQGGQAGGVNENPYQYMYINPAQMKEMFAAPNRQAGGASSSVTKTPNTSPTSL